MDIFAYKVTEQKLHGSQLIITVLPDNLNTDTKRINRFMFGHITENRMEPILVQSFGIGQMKIWCRFCILSLYLLPLDQQSTTDVITELFAIVTNIIL